MRLTFHVDSGGSPPPRLAWLVLAVLVLAEVVVIFSLAVIIRLA